MSMPHAEQLAAVERMVDATKEIIGAPAARELANNLVTCLADGFEPVAPTVQVAVRQRWRGGPAVAFATAPTFACFCCALTVEHVVDLQDRLVAAWSGQPGQLT